MQLNNGPFLRKLPISRKICSFLFFSPAKAKKKKKTNRKRKSDVVSGTSSADVEIPEIERQDAEVDEVIIDDSSSDEEIVITHQSGPVQVPFKLYNPITGNACVMPVGPLQYGKTFEKIHSAPYSVEITEFFYHSDFTCNQSCPNRNDKILPQIGF